VDASCFPTVHLKFCGSTLKEVLTASSYTLLKLSFKIHRELLATYGPLKTNLKIQFVQHSKSSQLAL